MKKELETQREQLKEQITREVDNYYEEISKGLETRTIRIDKIEQMLLDKKAKLNELVTDATGEAFSETEPQVKKNDVRNAADICENKAAHKK